MKSPRHVCALLALCFSLPSVPLLAAPTEHLGSAPVFLGLDPVRKELKLTKNQCVRLDQIRADFKSDARLITERAPASPVEQRAANSTVKALVSKYNQKATAVLTPEQLERLLQIERQMLGGLMLFLPAEQKQLGLSEGQIAALGKIRTDGEEYAGRVTASFEKGDVTRFDRLEALREYRVKQAAKCLRVLTPAQAKAFQNLYGKDFKAA